MNMRAGALLELRRRVPALGADVTLVPWLDAAMDADRIIEAALNGYGDAGGPHPLAGWAHTRDTAHMLAWTLNGTVPPKLAGRLPRPRRGPVAAAPQLVATIGLEATGFAALGAGYRRQTLSRAPVGLRSVAVQVSAA
ncbi:hypothetical protein [Streptomyces sp. NPDC085596]|uniref:hypothetical protein n=1 Tax=Streptomyces sp. NPDC085596 TaxID=3365731 RepID=UPI0037CDD6E3